jgi:hypothetical protein
VWIVQEVAIAKHVLLAWSLEEHGWEVCASGVAVAKEYGNTRPGSEGFWMPNHERYYVNAVDQARWRFRQGKKRRYFSCCVSFGSVRLVIRRIRSTLCLVDSGDLAGSVKPDYEKSWEVVYSDVMADIALQEGGMDALMLCFKCIGAMRRGGLPTWAANWSIESVKVTTMIAPLDESTIAKLSCFGALDCLFCYYV